VTTVKQQSGQKLSNWRDPRNPIITEQVRVQRFAIDKESEATIKNERVLAALTNVTAHDFCDCLA